jgi:hypothetical protein
LQYGLIPGIHQDLHLSSWRKNQAPQIVFRSKVVFSSAPPRELSLEANDDFVVDDRLEYVLMTSSLLPLRRPLRLSASVHSCKHVTGDSYKNPLQIHADVGTAFAFLVKMFFRIAVASVLSQQQFQNLRHKVESISNIDALFDISGNALNFVK